MNCIALSIQKKLHDPAVLEMQVKRMLADPKSEALTSNFASESGSICGNLKDVQPDPYVYPAFNKNLADSMRRETELFFDSIVRGDRNIVDLLTANYTYVDELLAKHYGIPNVLGSRFRRVRVARRKPAGVARSGQHSDSDIRIRQDFAGAVARQVHHGCGVRHAAAPASGQERAAAQRKCRQRQRPEACCRCGSAWKSTGPMSRVTPATS